jgi:hypothetical protein
MLEMTPSISSPQLKVKQDKVIVDFAFLWTAGGSNEVHVLFTHQRPAGLLGRQHEDCTMLMVSATKIGLSGLQYQHWL